MTRHLLVCFEGAHWAALSSRIDAGELPAFASVIERGACGGLAGVSSPSAIASAMSLATGCQAARHEVLASRIADPNSDRVRPVLADDRKVPTLWDILAGAGTVSHSVGWPASHGTRPPNGAAISDFFGNPLVSQDRSALETMIFPERLVDPLSTLVVHPEDTDAAMIEFFIPRWQEIDQDRDPRLALLGQGIAQTASIHNAFTWLLEHEPAPFATCYYNFAALVAALRNHGPTETSTDAFGQSTGPVWNYLDLMLRRIMGLAGDDTALWLLGLPAQPESGAAGFVIATGPGIAADGLVFGAQVADLVPTLLAEMGYLIDESAFDGRILPELVASVAGNSLSKRTLPDLQTLRHPVAKEIVRESSDLFREFLHRSEGLPVAENHLRWKQTRTHWRWLRASALVAAGRDLEALPLLEELAEEEPERADYAAQLADCQLHLGLYAEARSNAQVVAELVPSLATGLLLQARIEAEMCDLDSSARTLEQATTLQLEDPSMVLQLAITQNRLRRWDDAIETCQRVLERAPDSAEAHLGIARALLAQRRHEEAQNWALEAIARDYSQPLAHLVLGVALLRQDREAEAEAALETCLRLCPSLELGHHYLSRVRRRRGKPGQADSRHSQVMERVRRKNERLEAMRQEAQERETARARARAAEREAAPAPGGDRLRSHLAGVAPATPLQLQAVTGLPRAGLSLLMQILQEAGAPVQFDTDDGLVWSGLAGLASNPNLLAEAENKVFRLPSVLLPFLPRLHYYRLVIVHRPATELAASHLLQRRRPPAADTGLPNNFRDLDILLKQHEYETLNLLRNAPNIQWLKIDFAELIHQPREAVDKIAGFLGTGFAPNPTAVCEVVDPGRVHARSG